MMRLDSNVTKRPPKKQPAAEVPVPEPPPPSDFLRQRSTKLGLIALTLSSFALFAITCARTLTGEDCGELVSAAYLGGVAHPPAYPIWCILARLMTFIPIGEIAFRVALLSALCGALTIGTMAAVVLLLTRNWPAAIVASVGFGLMRDQWSQTTIAEVYTLNTFFLALCILLLLLWAERLSWKLFNLFAFTFGLSLTDHLTMLGAAPPFLAFMFLKGWRLLPQWRKLLVGTACFVLGLVPYVYLPIAARHDAPVNWGNPRTLSEVIYHVERLQYSEGGAELPPETWSHFGEQLEVLREAAFAQKTTPLMIAGMIGMCWLLKRRFSLGVMLLGTTLVSTIVLILDINLQTGFEDAYASRLFFVPAYLVVAIGGGWLVGHLLDLLPKRIGLAAGILAAAGGVLPPLIGNYKECDYSHYEIVHAHGKRLLNSVPLNAVLFPSSDHNTFPLLYLKFVEGMRPDVTIADKYGYIDPPVADAAPFSSSYTDKGKRSHEFRMALEAWLIDTWNRPVYFSSKGRVPDSTKWEMVSEGLWYRVRPKTFTAEQRAAADEAAWGAIGVTPGDEDPSPHDYTAEMVLSDLAFSRARRAVGQGDLTQAVAFCKKAAAEVPLSKQVMNNLGSLLAEAGLHEEARPYFRRSVELDPRYLTGARNLALTYLAEKQNEEARVEFQKVLKIDILDPVANRAMSQIARQEESWSEAAYYLEMVGKLERDARAFRDAGLICLYETKELEKAKMLLRASLSIDRNQPDIAEVEQNIKKKGEGDEDAAAKKKGEKGADGKPVMDEREKRAREAAERAFGTPGVREPSAPDPMGAVMPKMPGPKMPNVPGGGAQQGNPALPPSPKPVAPKPGGGGG
jgi:hypothetical protein